jgi:hypothetical protein
MSPKRLNSQKRQTPFSRRIFNPQQRPLLPSFINGGGVQPQLMQTQARLLSSKDTYSLIVQA